MDFHLHTQYIDVDMERDVCTTAKSLAMQPEICYTERHHKSDIHRVEYAEHRGWSMTYHPFSIRIKQTLGVLIVRLRDGCPLPVSMGQIYFSTGCAHLCG